MKKKSFAVFGMGRFGRSVAETLADLECEVLIVDKVDEQIQELAPKVTYAVRADVTEAGALESIGISNVDVAIVAITNNMEASIVATIYAKEAGVPYVMAKAANSLHATILDKVGADEVIYPEKAMGERVAKNMVIGGFIDLFELSSKFSMVEVKVPDVWIGKNLKELNVRERLHINVIGIKNDEDVEVNIDPNEKFAANQTLIMVGENENLFSIFEKK